MGKKDKILERLLRNQDIDRPSNDFAYDIMQMISGVVDLSDEQVEQIPMIEQAPKHMTDIVMDSIITAQPKSYEILNSREKRIHGILFLCIIAICASASFSAPSTMFIDTTSMIESMDTLFQSLNSGAPLMLIGGTALWIMDKVIRNRLNRI